MKVTDRIPPSSDFFLRRGHPGFVGGFLANGAPPEVDLFADDGVVPNSRLPVLLFRRAFDPETPKLGDVMEAHFARHGWSGGWRANVFVFLHYHSNAHEVMGFCKGSGTLQLGGAKGRQFDIMVGDVIVIPAGVAHQRISCTEDFSVVGAYPGGIKWDLQRGLPGERPQVDQHIAAVPIPPMDPLYGAEGGLRKVWANF